MIRGRPIKYTGRPDPYDRLVLAVLARAAKDLRTPHWMRLQHEALMWLNSHEVRELAAHYGIRIPPVHELQKLSKRGRP